MPVTDRYSAKPIFLELGEGFADEVAAADFPEPRLRFRNQYWASRIGLDGLTPAEWEKHFARFEPLPGNLPRPLALRYHGHQFRHYNPDLGDGRGFLFAQLADAGDKRVLDLGTKGSGQTPYSRRGDGRLTLKGAVREALATEMLESLGVYTSKTFSVFETGEALQRHDEPSPTRAAVLVRLSHSHIRFGTFQRLAFQSDKTGIEKLVEYASRNYFPHIAPGAASFLAEVTRRTAELAASWMVAGFVHGVLNTDNMNITGESFDYGPYRFLPTYDPNFTAAYFDETGLYAYGRQPETALWNLEQLALSLSQLLEREQLVEALQGFAPRFNSAVAEKFIARMGLISRGEGLDGELFTAAFDLLAHKQVGFEQFFHDWHGGLESRERALKSPEASAYTGEQFELFSKTVGSFEAMPEAKARLRDEYFARPKPYTLLIDEIEWIWDAIAKDDDWSRFEAKIEDTRRMGELYGRRAK